MAVGLSIAAALGLQAAVLYVPLLQQGFGTVPLTAGGWGLCVAAAASVLLVREAVKVAFRMRDRARG